jgi:hypothetical protein
MPGSLPAQAQQVPITFTIRGMPNAASGPFLGTVSFTSNDPDEPVIEALVVAYGASSSQPPLLLPADLGFATAADSRLETVAGSSFTLVPFRSGDNGFEYDAGSGQSYMYSKLSGRFDPTGNPNVSNAYLFKVPGVGTTPEIIKDDLSEDAVGFAVYFPAGLSYVIVPSGQGNDLLRVTPAGNVSVVLSDVFSLNSNLRTDSAGNIYISESFENFQIALGKFSASGAQLFRYPDTATVRRFDLAGDVVYTELGQKFDVAGNSLGSFEVVPGFLWLAAADASGNILFGDDSGGSADPQALTLEAPDGTLQDAGQISRKAFQADF